MEAARAVAQRSVVDRRKSGRSAFVGICRRCAGSGCFAIRSRQRSQVTEGGKTGDGRSAPQGKCLDHALSASGASLRGAWRSKYSCRVAKALRAVWRTAVEGDARFADSKSEIEFTNGIGGWMMRCGNALARPSRKYCAALTAKALVGQAHGPGETHSVSPSATAQRCRYPLRRRGTE